MFCIQKIIFFFNSELTEWHHKFFFNRLFSTFLRKTVFFFNHHYLSNKWFWHVVKIKLINTIWFVCHTTKQWLNYYINSKNLRSHYTSILTEIVWKYTVRAIMLGCMLEHSMFQQNGKIFHVRTLNFRLKYNFTTIW